MIRSAFDLYLKGELTLYVEFSRRSSILDLESGDFILTFQGVGTKI